MADNEFEEDFEKKFGVKYSEYVARVGKGLKISRIPEQYKARFIEIANKEFSSDYGMCIRELIRTWDAVFVNPNQELLMKIDILANQITDLNARLKQIEEKSEKEVSKDANQNYVKRGG